MHGEAKTQTNHKQQNRGTSTAEMPQEETETRQTHQESTRENTDKSNEDWGVYKKGTTEKERTRIFHAVHDRKEKQIRQGIKAPKYSRAWTQQFKTEMKPMYQKLKEERQKQEDAWSSSEENHTDTAPEEDDD